jgi:signal transduction histidine kinase
MTAEQVRELRHELRTPLNHLIGYAELLLEEEGLTSTNVAQLEGTAHAEHVGDIEFKGIAQPVPTYVDQHLAG